MFICRLVCFYAKEKQQQQKKMQTKSNLQICNDIINFYNNFTGPVVDLGVDRAIVVAVQEVHQDRGAVLIVQDHVPVRRNVVDHVVTIEIHVRVPEVVHRPLKRMVEALVEIKTKNELYKHLMLINQLIN